MRWLNKRWPTSNDFWKWSRYTSMQRIRPFLPCVLQGMSRNPKFDLFHPFTIPTKCGISTDRDQNPTSPEGGQDAKCQALHSLWSLGNARKSHILPISLSRNAAKMRKINKPSLKLYRFWRLSWYIDLPNFWSFLPCRRYLENARKHQIWIVS